ncbi:MAG: glycosyltransferase [bacterium]|nr:glycosyltransferase [bacterium]
MRIGINFIILPHMVNVPVLLVIGYVWPEPNSSAAGTRMLQLLSRFRQEEWRIVFATVAQKSGFEFNLFDWGIESQEIQLNDASFDDFVAALQPQMVLFDRFMIEEQFGWRVAKHCSQALRILDTEDLHFLRHARHTAWKEEREVRLSDLQSDYAKREIASILRCDCTLVISTFEMDLLLREFNLDAKILYYYPLLMEADEAVLPNFEERVDFIFIGNFWHEPNWQAVKYLKEKVWPILANLVPKAKMQIYGAYPSQKVLQLQQVKQRFIVNGRAADALEVVRMARVCLAPLLFGAGLKGKLLEAMKCGTPSVTTWVGAEGIADAQDWPGFVANEPEEIAKAAAQLYVDAEYWNRMQAKGFTVLANRFRPKLHEDALMAHFEGLRQNLDAHRQANFLGAILQHHTLASTEYMSRWIEAKGGK